MKYFIILVLVMISVTSFAQEKEQIVEADLSIESILLPYVQKLSSAVDTGAEFVVQEAPIVVKQFLYFRAFNEWFHVILAILCVTYLAKAVARFFVTKSAEAPEKESGYVKWYEIEKGYWAPELKTDVTAPEGFYWASIVVIRVFGIILFFNTIFDAVKVTFFPKLYLVEEFINIVS